MHQYGQPFLGLPCCFTLDNIQFLRQPQAEFDAINKNRFAGGNGRDGRRHISPHLSLVMFCRSWLHKGLQTLAWSPQCRYYSSDCNTHRQENLARCRHRRQNWISFHQTLPKG